MISQVRKPVLPAPTKPALTLSLPSDQATTALGIRLAQALHPGDTLLLEGPVGAGKSLLARAIIQARQSAHGPIEDVPSPSFTLVQTYTAGPDTLIHADLYRLAGGADIVELGLDEAAQTAILLVEWPERWGPETPARHLKLHLSPDAQNEAFRHLTATPAGAGWDHIRPALSPTPRQALRESFLAGTPWRYSTVTPFPGDASKRRYFRIG
ncbi:MAG: tRNA (adenosine(37)-N6)-threonylcarbamoyltransferase complex ATPase subunit type 1 TsaE, partial [Pseudomonadota bacterium]